MNIKNLNFDCKINTNPVYLNKDLFRLIKEFAGSSGTHLGLKINGYNDYFIRPIPTKYDLIIKEDVYVLTKWRNLYRKSFLTEFDATETRTVEWLSKKVHYDDSRILFMIENNLQQQIAYLGIGYINWEISYVEADSIVSGGFAPKGLMTKALKTLLKWANGQLNLTTVGVRVLSDNPALSFYKKMGFSEIKRVPLIRKEFENFIAWSEESQLKTADRYLVYHIWKQNSD
jgi:RimJ/RimL family protein N-acetyltransferase